MTVLLFARHGETDWNASGRLQGHTDRPLNDYGRRQAAELAAQLEADEVAAIYASDLSRAKETAEILGARRASPPASGTPSRSRARRRRSTATGCCRPSAGSRSATPASASWS